MPRLRIHGTMNASTLQHHLDQRLHDLWELIFPAVCPLCGETSTDRTAENSAGCSSCRPKVAPRSLQKCSRCAAPVGPHLEHAGSCYHCRDERYRFSKVVSLGEYRDELRSAILCGKENYGGPTIAALTRLLANEVRTQFADPRFDWIVPVPQHWWSSLWRTHYSPETMAHLLSRELRIPCLMNRLRKVRWTLQQTDVTASERRRQLRNAFRASKRVQWGRVLLVDDVMTTGATCDRSARALLSAGASEVAIAVLARSVGGR